MFYDKYVYYCNKIGKSPSKVAIENSISKTTVTRWKNGGGITDANARKLSLYFNVSVKELLDETDIKSEIVSKTNSFNDLSDEEKLIIEVYREADTEQRFNIIQTVMEVKKAKEKTPIQPAYEAEA